MNLQTHWTLFLSVLGTEMEGKSVLYQGILGLLDLKDCNGTGRLVGILQYLWGATTKSFRNGNLFVVA